MFNDTLIRLRTLRRLTAAVRSMMRGYKHPGFHAAPPQDGRQPALPESRPLLKYFSEHTEGPGIWKFKHYFDIYERHFAKFRDTSVHVLEIGVYSGGSLEMWKHYFGKHSAIYGVDLEPRCKAYEAESVRIFIGDQADRNFWASFKKQVPILDIVIDDGGHMPEQQIVSLEELLPHLRPGGVYLCEDVDQPFSEFASYVSGLSQHLNKTEYEFNLNDNERRSVSRATPFQSAVAGVHSYPYVTVIERTSAPVLEFVAPKHGSQWEPFLK